MKRFIFDIIRTFALFFTALLFTNLINNEFSQLAWNSFILFPAIFSTTVLSITHLLFMWSLRSGKNLSVFQTTKIASTIDSEVLVRKIEKTNNWKLSSKSEE